MTAITLESADRQAALRDRQLPRLGERIGLDGLTAHLDRVGSATVVPGADVAFTWDDADQHDPGWMPQGISTSADAGRTADASMVLVSWYATDATGRDAASRISVVDRSDPASPRYAHVRLVEPTRRWWQRRGAQRDVPVHAGGIVWWGSTLLVASTRGGLRVFDLDHLVRTSDGRLLLPQSGEHRAKVTDSARPLRWSFISVDRSDPDQPWLIAGEYDRKGTGTRIVRFALDPATVAPAGARSAAVEVVDAGIASMQGATRIDGVYHVSASHGAERPGHLYTGGVDGFVQHARRLPVGPEDLSYEAGTDRLWTVTEYPGKRVVVAVPRPPHTHAQVATTSPGV
jgi:hypothetical protein